MTLGQPQGTLSQYVNLQALKTLLQASVTASATTTHRGGPDGAGLAATVTITGTSAAPAVGFFLRADVPRGTAAGTELAGGQRAAVLDLEATTRSRSGPASGRH